MVTQSSLLLELSRRRCISLLNGVFGTFCGSESHWVSSPYCLNLGENRFWIGFQIGVLSVIASSGVWPAIGIGRIRGSLNDSHLPLDQFLAGWRCLWQWMPLSGFLQLSYMMKESGRWPPRILHSPQAT